MQLKNPLKGMRAVTDMVALAGGQLVGRTRLQKTQVLLEMAGLGQGFSFAYKHYGPFSQEVVEATETAELFGEITEEQHPTQWGGTYSIFRTQEQPREGIHDSARKIVELAKAADPVELELAATAAFLAYEGMTDAWGETAKRKPEKVSEGRLENAKILYERFKEIETPNGWPI